MKTLEELQDILNFHRQEKYCGNCRYYRTFNCDAECLLLGRTLAVGDEYFLMDCQYERVCNGWKKIPKTWKRENLLGLKSNPHWKDIYITRETLEKLRSRISMHRRK